MCAAEIIGVFGRANVRNQGQHRPCRSGVVHVND
jgi:hypothetical protein